jgi:lipopolysaccharide/colanic/teichoic acid biosynthesis glycosyltransferase
VVADMEVAASLYKTATGFHYKETSTGTNDMGSFMTENKRYATPDFRAIRFWLMNRQKDKWRDKTEQDITTKGESLNKPMSDEQFNQIVNMLNGTESSKGERVEKTA